MSSSCPTSPARTSYKSKPTQHSVKELQGMGISPDIIILRADGSVGSDIRRKISTVLQCQARVRHREPDRAQPLRVPADARHRRLGRCGGQAAGHLTSPAPTSPSGRRCCPGSPPAPQTVHHRPRGQVRQAARRLSVGDGEPLTTPALRTTVRWRSSGSRREDLHRSGTPAGRLCGRGRHHRARRLRRPRHRGHDPGRTVCP